MSKKHHKARKNRKKTNEQFPKIISHWLIILYKCLTSLVIKYMQVEKIFCDQSNNCKHNNLE